MRVRGKFWCFSFVLRAESQECRVSWEGDGIADDLNHVHDCAPDSRPDHVVALFLYFLSTMDGLRKLFFQPQQPQKAPCSPLLFLHKSKPCLEWTSHLSMKSLSSEATFNFHEPSPGSRDAPKAPPLLTTRIPTCHSQPGHNY